MVRDVDALAALDLGVQALASIPQKSHRKGLGETHVTLNFGGLMIESGMFIYADNNGILVSDISLLNDA
jgi:regulator of ribonuclease activity A